MYKTQKRRKLTPPPLVRYDLLITFEPFYFPTGIVQLADQRQRFFLHELLRFQHLHEFVRVFCAGGTSSMRIFITNFIDRELEFSSLRIIEHPPTTVRTVSVLSVCLLILQTYSPLSSRVALFMVKRQTPFISFDMLYVSPSWKVMQTDIYRCLTKIDS